MSDQLVQIEHSSVSGTAWVPEDAYTTFWGPVEGWTLVSGGAVTYLPAPMRYRGAYSAGISYSPGDVVMQGGLPYVALVPVQAVTPGTDSTKWTVAGSSGAVSSVNGQTGAVDLTGTYANVPTPGTPATALVADSGAAAALLAGGAVLPGRAGDTAGFNHRQRLPFNAGLSQLRRDGTTTVNLINMGNLPGADAGVRNLCYIGDPGIEYLSVITQKGLDMANRPIIDLNYIGNLETTLSPRLVQALDSTVPGYDTKTVGVASMALGGVAGGIMGPGLVDRIVCTSGLSIENSRTTVKNSRFVVEVDPGVQTLALVIRDTVNSINAASLDVFGNLICRTFTGGAVSVANVPIVSSPLGAAFRAAIFRGFAAQTANVVEWQDSGGVVGLAVDKALRVKSTVQTAPVLADLVDGETVWHRTAGGNIVFTSRDGGALKTATVPVA